MLLNALPRGNDDYDDYDDNSPHPEGSGLFINTR